MKRILTQFILAASACFVLQAAAVEPGFISLTDGKTFAGWKPAMEHTNTWSIEDGAFVAHGERCHLYYVGDQQPFKNFILKVDVMTETNSNGGIYFHTKYQEQSWPTNGFETQVNNTHSDWKKTGSLYDVRNVKKSAAQDYKWWTQTITVQGNHVTIAVDDKIVMDYHEKPGTKPGKQFTRKIDQGTFALQAHDPKSIVRYKNIRVKKLD